MRVDVTMNQLQRVVWLARRNFIRGSFSNLATIFIVAVSCLVFFVWYLHRMLPAPAAAGASATGMLATSEMLLVVLLVMNFFALLVIFWLINRVRYHEIGLLRGIGARRFYIFLLLLVETWFIVLFGAILAVILGFIIGKTQGELFAPFFGSITGTDGVLAILGSAGLALLSTMLGATLAALYPAVVICGIEPYSAIRNRE